MLKLIVLTSVAAPPMGRDGGTRFKRGGAVHPLCWRGVAGGGHGLLLRDDNNDNGNTHNNDNDR